MDCQPLTLSIDGEALVGVEDMDVLGPKLLVLSAYDRIDSSASPKGLFTFDVETSQVERLTPETSDLLPHGINVFADDAAVSIFVIDRSAGLQEPKLLKYRYDDGSMSGPETIMDRDIWDRNENYPCNLNDVYALSSTEFLLTDDRASCDSIGKMLDNVFGRENGRLIRFRTNGKTNIAGDQYFANGVATFGPHNNALIAETRSNSLNNGLFDIHLAGAPDNLSYDSETQTVWAALHPSLLSYALHRQGFDSFAQPSRIAQISADLSVAATYETDDFKAATTALMHDGKLYLSGAYATGIAICELPA